MLLLTFCFLRAVEGLKERGRGRDGPGQGEGVLGVQVLSVNARLLCCESMLQSGRDLWYEMFRGEVGSS